MSLETARARFEQRQVDLFRDECTVERLSTEPSFDATTGLIVPGTFTTTYSGPCLLRPFDRAAVDVIAGEEEVRLRRTQLKLPKDADVERNDIVTVTASTFDASLVDRPHRVSDVLRDGWQIVRVVILEEIT